MERPLLKGIADNPALLEELKALLEEQFSLDGISTSMGNEEMGAIVRARMNGSEAVQNAFREINKYKTVVDKPRESMPGR